MINKIALGTVQFGMDYGISNKKGKIKKKEVFDILEFAHLNGIDTLDTAQVYGDSESIIGEFIKTNKINFKMITKFKNFNIFNPNNLLLNSLHKLNCDKLYGVLIHDFNEFKENETYYYDLIKLKEKNKISKIGFSLYYPFELEYIIKKNIPFDIIQIPYNIFDRRFESFFPLLKSKNIEIHIRSIFLQGLLLMSSDDIKGNLIMIKDKLHQFNKIVQDLNISPVYACLYFGLANLNIDRIVMGVDGIESFKEDVNIIKKIEKDLLDKRIDLKLFLELEEKDENILLPKNWRI